MSEIQDHDQFNSDMQSKDEWAGKKSMEVLSTMMAVLSKGLATKR